MRLEDDIDFTTLNWVKSELDEALQRARESLEAYVDDPEDSGPMRTCAQVLHQVQGTLRMVELYGAAMVVQEMEQLVQALLEDKVEKRDDAYAALMSGLVQLPDYLERLQSSHRDVSVVLLPLLNELRNSRGAESLHESVLFTPNLEAPLPRSGAGYAGSAVRRDTQARRDRNCASSSSSRCWPGSAARAASRAWSRCATPWMRWPANATAWPVAACGGSPRACSTAWSRGGSRNIRPRSSS